MCTHLSCRHLKNLNLRMPIAASFLHYVCLKLDNWDADKWYKTKFRWRLAAKFTEHYCENLLFSLVFLLTNSSRKCSFKICSFIKKYILKSSCSVAQIHAEFTGRFLINKSHKKTKFNSVSVHLSVPGCCTQKKPTGSCWRRKSVKTGSFLKMRNNFLKQLLTVFLIKRYSNRRK